MLQGTLTMLLGEPPERHDLPPRERRLGRDRHGPADAKRVGRGGRRLRVRRPARHGAGRVPRRRRALGSAARPAAEQAEREAVDPPRRSQRSRSARSCRSYASRRAAKRRRSSAHASSSARSAARSSGLFLRFAIVVLQQHEYRSTFASILITQFASSSRSRSSPGGLLRFARDCRASIRRDKWLNGRGRVGRGLREDEIAVLRVDQDRVAGDEVALEQPQRQRVLEQPLDRALERPRAVGRVPARFGDRRPSRRRSAPARGRARPAAAGAARAGGRRSRRAARARAP